MKFKLAKCGVLTNDIVQRLWHIPFRIHGLPVPVVSAYKYLRFPRMASGIDFVVHRDGLINKT